MQDEKRRILEMVANQEISQEDALRLLDALEGAPIDQAYSTAMSNLREGAAPPPPSQEEPGPIPYTPCEPAAQAQGDIWEEMNHLLSQTAAEAAGAISEGVQWAKDAVKKIPGLHQWWGNGEDLPQGEEPLPYNQQEKPPHVEKLEIEWVNGPVEVVPWEGDWVNVTEYARAPLEEGQKLDLLITDKGTMRIRWARGRQFWQGLGLSKYLLVQLPVGMELERLQVEDISGSVRAEGLAAQEVALHTTSGRVEAIGVRAPVMEACSVSGRVRGENLTAGRLALKTTSGKVEAVGVQADQLRMSSVSGKLRVENTAAGLLEVNTTSGKVEAAGFGSQYTKLTTVSGGIQAYGNGEELQVKSMSGHIHLQTQQPPRSIRLENGTGRITLALPAGSGFQAEYETTAGRFTTDFPVSGELGGKSGRAVCGDGGIQVSLHTLSGKMEIVKAEG